MKPELEHVLPPEIEKRSFEIIESELPHPLDPALAPIIKRVIHTTADFEYADSLCFSQDAVGQAHRSIQNGACIVTDTNMARAGINKAALNAYGGEVFCFMADADVAQSAEQNGTTRAAASMEKACSLRGPLIFVIGNAPTALIKLNDLIREGRVMPDLIVGVPVGFVNVETSKELIMRCGVPFIVARGRKGGSNVAAAICNALLYMM